MFSPQISTKSLAVVCQSLGTMLDSGVPIQRAFTLAGDKVSDARCRDALRDIAEAIERGEEVAEAMQARGERFPPLMIQMVGVAEQTGAMPEILRNLAEHYENTVRLRRDFKVAIIWPVFQFGAAVLIVALLIYILGWIAQSRGGQPLDVLGFGLYGAKGAFLWLAMVLGSLGSVFVVYIVASRSLSGRRVLHSLAMKIPVVGNCMQSFALARFSWAYYLTQQTGMAVDESIRESLKATSNGAFVDRAGVICRRINSGDPVADALRAAGIFPNDFLSMVEVAETSGTVPEALHRISPQLQNDARRSLQGLTTMLAWGVWLMVAVFIIFLIFRIVFWYVGMIDDAIKQI